ncbi:MAG TPA: LysR family transcriptional regulator [Mycobacteriales bacterium]|nr:LysR family transcriptional regulator [Mycobacteriales bacterium]
MAQRARRRPDLELLDLFLGVAEHGSLGAAARTRDITQPAASAALARLERRLGLHLVARSPRGSRLTSAGAAVADWSRELLNAADRFGDATEALRARGAGQLRVAASMTVAEYLVPGWLAELRAAAPGVSVGLRVGNSARVARLVRAGTVELGFVEGSGLPPGLRSRAVAVDELTVVVGPRHPWTRRRRPVLPADVAATALVLREPGSGTREILDEALAAHGLTADPALELGSTVAIKAAVTGGAGAAVLSALAVGEDVAQGRLVAVTVPDLDLRRRLRAVWRPGGRLDAPAATLLACAVRAGRTRRDDRVGRAERT